jgi:hypothetical protein
LDGAGTEEEFDQITFMRLQPIETNCDSKIAVRGWRGVDIVSGEDIVTDANAGRLQLQ